MRVDTLQEKLRAAEVSFHDQDEASKEAQLVYWQTTMPALMQHLYEKEEERCTAVHNSARNWCLLDKHRTDADSNSCDKRLDMIEATDLAGDFEDLHAEHMNSNTDTNEDAKGGSTMPAISVRTLVNPLKTGRVMKRADESESVWKPRYFVLMGDRVDPSDLAYVPTSGRLYYFESEDALKPNGIVDMSGASVYSVDDTMSRGERKNIFLISTTLTTTENNQLVTRKQVMYLSCETLTEKTEWMELLKRYALCCMPCVSTALSDPVSLNLDQVDQVVANFPRANSKEVSYRTVRSLTLWVMEVRDLQALESDNHAAPHDANNPQPGGGANTAELLFNAL